MGSWFTLITCLPLPLCRTSEVCLYLSTTYSMGICFNDSNQQLHFCTYKNYYVTVKYTISEINFRCPCRPELTLCCQIDNCSFTLLFFKYVDFNNAQAYIGQNFNYTLFGEGPTRPHFYKQMTPSLLLFSIIHSH